MAGLSLGNVVISCVLLLGSLPPSFQSCPGGGIYPASVNEGPSSKGHVLAQYGNNSISNLTLQNDANGYLAINVSTQGGQPPTFTLYIAKEIDSEALRSDDLTLEGSVICSDQYNPSGYSPSTVLVSFVPVNEFPPRFVDSPYTQSLREDAAVHSVVFSFLGRATDEDYPSANQMLYKIENDSSPFAMTNGNTVILNQSLDYEREPHTYVLTISAQELGSQPQLTSNTTLTITITDVDDQGPRFDHNTSYTLALPEGTYHDDIFTTQPVISAQDGDSLNAALRFELDPTSVALGDRFKVLTNGSLQISGTLQPGQIILNVRVSQIDRPADRFAIASVMVTVYDVNDHSPVMSSDSYSGSVLEAAGSGTVVLTVSASDADQGVNSSFQFHLSDSNVPFSIGTEGTVGILWVNGSLDRETTQFYLLHVYAREDQTPDQRSSNLSAVNVTVLDVNDNSPVFHEQPYQFTLQETDLAGTVVGQVNATDEDSGQNGEVVYSIADTTITSNVFAVDSSSGVITLTRNLTQQDVGVVYLGVRAEDRGPAHSRRSDTTQVTITVEAVNENRPEFTSASGYNFTVRETVQTGVSVGVIAATDRDNDPLTYRLIDGGQDFKVEGSPATLLVNGSLDLDTDGAQPLRAFGVVVSDGRFESTASVTVRVTPVNEYPPVPEQGVYVSSVRENETLVEAVVKINATDGDGGADGEVSYVITAPPSGSGRGPFSLNASTGLLSLRCPDLQQDAPCLDYSTQRQYTLEVQLTDGGTPARSAYCTVIVNVEDVNNLAPSFSPATITGSVAEDASPGTTVLKLEANDEDTPSSDLTYSLEHVQPAGWLTLNGSYLLTNGPLDAESSQSVSATVRVWDGVQQGLGSLNVTVLDVNDNYPQISLPSTSVDIPENAEVGSLVTTLTAQDRDVTQGGHFLFFFGSSPSGHFALNSSTGALTVAAPFDRRLRREYDVTVTVSDNSAPPKMNSTTVHVVITDSNSAPEFVDSANSSVSLYAFNVSEERAAGAVIGQVIARDPDSGSSGQVRYSIQQGNERGAFRLDDSTGELSLREKLDYEVKSSYSLTVVASDNSYEPKRDTATVIVTVEDVVEAPQWPASLPPVHLTSDRSCGDVQLSARPQDILHTSSSSPSPVLYSLLNFTDHFLIHNDTGLVQRKGTLDPGTFAIGLRACSALDVSICSDTVLTVVVSDDNVITFCPPFLTVKVNESEGIGFVLVDMNSTKGDTNITYSLQDEAQLPFRIDTSTGVITVSGGLDREETPHYTLEVHAVNPPTGASAAAQVTVVIEDAADSAPTFVSKRYDGQVSEAAHVGDPVLTLPANLPLRVSAEDEDLSPTLTYSIVDTKDSSRGAFSINSTTGEVTLQRSVDLENMTSDSNGQFTLTVMVTDGYYTDNATLIITVLNDNDNSPVFDPDTLTFNVSEAQGAPFDVATLRAEDLDEGDTDSLQYSLLSSDPDLPFVVHPSGLLQQTKSLDRETVPSYTFTVMAKDPSGENGTAQVNIQVLDANEAPYFENSTYVFHITEGAAGLTFERNLTAVDGDLGNNAVLTFHIESGNQNNAFEISTSDRATGVLRVASELDREQTSSLTLTLTAVDSGQPPLTATCTVMVKVTDVNDNDPVWARDSYTAIVSEGAANNTLVQFQSPEPSATDQDEGVNGPAGLVYSLTPSFPAVPFRVHPSTGHIYVTLANATDRLDRETSANYTLTLVARDEEGRGRKGNTTVVVRLSNVNDHPPLFPQARYTFRLPEDAPLGHLLATLNATDRDHDDDDVGNNVDGAGNSTTISSGSNPPLLRFYILSTAGGGSSGHGPFYLDPVSGQLRVSGPLDRETWDHYVLALGVYDGLLWGNATVDIIVEDVNDNCPSFNEQVPLTLSVIENQDPGVIHTFNVTDDDSGRNADVTLFINDTSASHYLTLSANGTLSTRQKLDREKDDQQSLTFTVWARDAGVPPCVTSLHARLEVQGDNEDTPVVCRITRQQNPLCGTNIAVKAFDGDSEGTLLAVLTWRDSDEGEEGVATLSLEQDPEQLLALNQSSATLSLLTLARPLDRADLWGRGSLGADNSTYTAVVRAKDGGPRPRNSSVVVTLTVRDKAPSMPAFLTSMYNFSVTENQPATVIGSTEAVAQSNVSTLNYALQSTSEFTIDPTGSIATVDTLDREKRDEYTFLVLAWESPVPSETATAVVLVRVMDENDNSPHLPGGSSYDLTVLENRDQLTLMTFGATDQDAGQNGEVTFSLVNSSFDNTFTLNATSGQLWLSRSLDRETQSSYTLHVQALDGGSPPRSSEAVVNIHVKDANDNEPIFSKDFYVAFLDENAAAATLVKNVTATDADSGLNGQVSYQLVPDDEASASASPLFFINEFSGSIYTARGLHSSSEQIFNLTVKAQDLGSPPKASLVPVYIYVNDLSPILPQVVLDPDTVALVLGTPAGTLMPVNVSGGSGTYSFSIVEGNEDGVFAMDLATGQMTVTSELSKIATYQLTIRVVNLEAPQYYSDGKLTVMVTTVKLEQENYAAVVPENREPPSLLLDINSNAERAGVPVLYHLQGQGVAQGVFTIVASTGQLYCNQTLDREQRPEYTMTVTVQLNNGVPSVTRRRRALSSEAEIRVIVDDVNDNAPRFDITSNLFGIPSSAPINYVVTTLQAKDPDAGTGGQIAYTATGGDTDVFYVTSDGKVTSLVPMTSRKSGDQFRLLVNATDNQGTCGTSTSVTLCHRARIELKIVVVPSSDRFGLVANITVSAFYQKQQFYLRNLSDILNMTLQLDKVEPHQDTTVDTSKSDIYFYAFDAEGRSIPYTTIDERVTSQAAAIRALFGGSEVQLFPVTEPPTQVRVQVRNVLGEAEVAVLVVACLIFAGSFVAIILTVRAWKKQKEFQRREEAAVRARQKLEQETRELADKLQETSFVADPEEPLELYRSPPVAREIVTEVQEVVVNFDNENTGVDTVTLRRDVLRRTKAAELEALLREERDEQDSATDSHPQPTSIHERKTSAQQDNGPSSTGKTATSPPRDKSENSGGNGKDVLSRPDSSLADPKTDPKTETSRKLTPDNKAIESGNENGPVLVKSSAQGNTAVKVQGENGSGKMQPATAGQEGDVTTNSNVGVTAGSTSLEEPAPDYQKRVSFPNHLNKQKNGTDASGGTPKLQNSGSHMPTSDSKKMANGSVNDLHKSRPSSGPDSSGFPPATNYLQATSRLLDSIRASKATGVTNPVYQEDGAVLDGWAEDYDRQATTSPLCITAL